MLQKPIYVFAFILSLLSANPLHNDIKWAPYGFFKAAPITESSGIVKSRQYQNVFWTHNDSGHEAQLFATTTRGDSLGEIGISGATNIDWEDIAVDDSGHIFIGDSGNNLNKRKNLVIYVVDEPDPVETHAVQVVKRIPFQYPDQKYFPNLLNLNFDCEALFWASGHLYILTKDRSDRKTRLYRFGALKNNQKQVVTKIGEFEIDGMVTAADVSPDGEKLLVLCYEYIYLFEKPPQDDNYLSGHYKRIRLEARQSEGICFDGAYFLFANEQGEIYRLPLSYFDTHDAFLPPLPKLVVEKTRVSANDGLSPPPGWTQMPLRANPFSQLTPTKCDTPLVQITWSERGIELLIRNWRFPPELRNNRRVLQIMLGLNHKRTVALEKGAYVWDLVWNRGNLRFKRFFPPSVHNLQVPQWTVEEDDGKKTVRIFIPSEILGSPPMVAGKRYLFNLILNPFKSCEWYWATDSTTYSYLNPYVWGELLLID